MVIFDEILVKYNDQRDKCYSFTTNYNQQLKYLSLHTEVGTSSTNSTNLLLISRMLSRVGILLVVVVLLQSLFY